MKYAPPRRGKHARRACRPYKHDAAAHWARRIGSTFATVLKTLRSRRHERHHGGGWRAGMPALEGNFGPAHPLVGNIPPTGNPILFKVW